MKLKDLAKAANVSLSTASKALRGSKEIHEDTIKHVLKIAEDSGYFIERKKQKNESVRIKGKVIIVVPEVVSVYYSKLATVITEKLRRKNIASQIFFCNFDNDLKNYIVSQSLRDDGVVGIIALDGNFFKIFQDIDFPIVYSDSNGLYSGLLKAIDHLVSLGHRRIYFASEELTRSKVNLFLDAINEKKLGDGECKCFFSKYRFEKAGFDIGQRLISSEDVPTAVICAYDEIAFGLISAFMQGGLEIPKDVSIVGINNVPSSQFYPVPLTTIAFETDEYCDALVERFLGEVNKRIKNDTNFVKYDLIIRNSTSVVKK